MHAKNKALSVLLIAASIIGKIDGIAIEKTRLYRLGPLLKAAILGTIEQSWNNRSAIYHDKSRNKWNQIYTDASPTIDNPELAAQQAADTFAKLMQEIGRRDPKLLQEFKEKFFPGHNQVINHYGASTSHYQFEGDDGNACSCNRFYQMQNKELPGKAVDMWDNHQQILRNSIEAGISMQRMSISWSRVSGVNRDPDALDRYKKIIKDFKDNGIEVQVTLHHYTVPAEFEDKGGDKYLGGFTQENNTKDFVEFAKKVYRALGQDVHLFSTCNLGYEFNAYGTRETIAPGIFYYVARLCKEQLPDSDKDRIRQIYNTVHKTDQKEYTVDQAIDLYLRTRKYHAVENRDNQTTQEALKNRFGRDTFAIHESVKAMRESEDETFNFLDTLFNNVNAFQDKHNLQVAHEVKKNIAKAHAEISKAIKGTSKDDPNSLYNQLRREKGESVKEPQIGIQITINPLDPEIALFPQGWCTKPRHFGRAIKNMGIASAAGIMNNGALYNFFRTGTYNAYIPTKLDVFHRDDFAPNTLDWIGINTYESSVIDADKQVGPPEGQHLKTSSDKSFNTHVFARAKKEVCEQLTSTLQQRHGKIIPIFFTEYGIAPKDDNQQRTYDKQTLYTFQVLNEQMLKKIKKLPKNANRKDLLNALCIDCAHLRWSFADNYEWGNPLGSKRYGIFKTNFATKDNATVTTEAKPGSDYLIKYYNTIQQLRNER